MAAPPDDQMPSAVAELVEARRLGGEEGARGTFTVAKTRALLELRKLPQPSDWHWTVPLLRAANVLSDSPEGIVDQEEDGETLVTRLVFAVPGASFEGLELRDLLAGALRPDVGPGDAGEEHRERLERFAALVGRAINRALAGDIDDLEVLTPHGGRRFVRSEHAEGDGDPFVARPTPTQSPGQSFAIRLREAKPNLGRRFGAWISGRSDVVAVLTELWRDMLVGADTENDAGGGMSLAPLLAGERIELGNHARLVTARDADAVWLVRDGTKVIRLDHTLSESGLPVRRLRGWIECPRLRLTADEQGVARDGAYELLVAWLHDLFAHTFEEGKTVAPQTEQDWLPSFGLGEESKQHVVWPTTLSAVPTASGYTISLQALQKRVGQKRDLLYVWPHQTGAVPASAQARVLAVWPSELRLLEEALEGARLVPMRALGTDPEFDRVDLTSLNQGSLDPVPLEFDHRFETAEGEHYVLDVVAYIHRFPTATMGNIVLLAYEREIAQIRDPRRVIPGLSLLCRVRGADDMLDLDLLRRTPRITDAIGRHCHGLASEHLEQLLSHAMKATSPWENPLVRTALDQLTAVRVGLRYVLRGGRPRLTWDESVLLDLPVATERDGKSRTLRHALEQCRDVGFVIEAGRSRRWSTLEASDGSLEPWIIDEHARPLFERVVGRASILRMPVVPEAYPLVRSLEDQRKLMGTRSSVTKDIERSSTDPLARLRLAGHVLVARGLGREELGVSSVVLFSRYDPRAAAPTRLVSLDGIGRESSPPGLAFPGAVSRELGGPVLEVSPGVASLLHEVLSLEPESAPRPESSLIEGEIPGPVRRRSRTVAPLVSLPVVHPLAVGSLEIAGDGSSRGVALWSRGLRVGELRLPEPLGRVSGRLWLTRNAPHDELRRAVTNLARDLLAELVRQRCLMPPDGPRRPKLEAVINYARDKVRRDDPMGLSPMLGVIKETPSTGAALDRSLRAWPIKRLSPQLERWLAEIVIQSIGFRVHLDTAFLSWKAAKVQRIRADGSVELELGRRNEWVQRALEVGTSRDKNAPFEAAVLVVAEFFRQAREQKFFMHSPADEAVAYWRLLALLVENASN